MATSTTRIFSRLINSTFSFQSQHLSFSGTIITALPFQAKVSEDSVGVFLVCIKRIKESKNVS
jgi:hypothetical protein